MSPNLQHCDHMFNREAAEIEANRARGTFALGNLKQNEVVGFGCRQRFFPPMASSNLKLTNSVASTI